MVVKNLTNKQQEFDVKELIGENRVYTIYLMPYSTTELSLVSIVSPERYEGILEINGQSIPKKETSVLPKSNPVIPKEDTNSDEEKFEESKEDTTPVVNVDNFVCEVCGAEFASARGLAAHKNKAHPAE